MMASDMQRWGAIMSLRPPAPRGARNFGLSIPPQPVTAPSEADETRRAYLAMAPVVYRGLGSFTARRRFLISEADTSTSSRRRFTSMTIGSPPFRAATGAL